MWIWVRSIAAAVAFTGVVAGFIVNVDRATREGQDLGAVLANYFSLFTIISSLLSVAALILAARWWARHPGNSPEPLGIALFLAAVTGPVLLLGVVYNVLLRPIPPSATALADGPVIHVFDTYAVEVLHVVMPLYFLVDLLLAPRRHALPWWSLAVLVGYPLVWTAYTMIRGELVANPDGSTPWWYPYPFLDPHGDGGYATALLYIGAIMVAFLAIGSALIAITRYRAKRAASRNGVGTKATPTAVAV